MRLSIAYAQELEKGLIWSSAFKAQAGIQAEGTATMQETISPLALRPREAARALGISARLLWQLTRDDRIPCVRIGGTKRRTVLYPLAELQAWLTANTKTGGEQ